MRKGGLIIVSQNILQRTLHFFSGRFSGTCFIVDYEDRQYIVTAGHVVRGMPDSATIQIMHEQNWENVAVNLVGHGEDGIDISVLAAEVRLSAEPPLPLSTIDRATLGQDVYLLGFPFGLGTGRENLNENFPLPFVKKAVLSAQDRPSGIYCLDGHVTHGFSGGPVVFNPSPRAWFRLRARSFSVGAVIWGYIREDQSRLFESENPSPHITRNTAGIVLCYDIKYAVDLINRNPIGFNLRD